MLGVIADAALSVISLYRLLYSMIHILSRWQENVHLWMLGCRWRQLPLYMYTKIHWSMSLSLAVTSSGFRCHRSRIFAYPNSSLISWLHYPLIFDTTKMGKYKFLWTLSFYFWLQNTCTKVPVQGNTYRFIIRSFQYIWADHVTRLSRKMEDDIPIYTTSKNIIIPFMQLFHDEVK